LRVKLHEHQEKAQPNGETSFDKLQKLSTLRERSTPGSILTQMSSHDEEEYVDYDEEEEEEQKPIEEETRLTLRGDAVVSEGEEDDAPTPPPMFYDIAYESDNRSYEGLPTSSDKVGTASKLIFKKIPRL
jgi:hypothetical protein